MTDLVVYLHSVHFDQLLESVDHICPSVLILVANIACQDDWIKVIIDYQKLFIQLFGKLSDGMSSFAIIPN
jgi:hypothetical protein